MQKESHSRDSKLYPDYSGFLLPVFTDTAEWARLGSFVLNWFTVSSLLGILSPILIIATRYCAVLYFRGTGVPLGSL